MPRTATIGPAVYQRVNELVGEGKTRTEAFQAIAQERGANAGTVSANFYRTARSRGSATGRRRKTNRRTSAPTRRPRGHAASGGRTSSQKKTNGDLTALANQIGDLVQQLVRQVEERDRRLREVLG